MMRVSIRALLLLGWTGGTAIPAMAQISARTPATDSIAARAALARPGAQQPAAAPVGDTPATPPRSTAARPAMLGPASASPVDARRPAPVYRPDFGGQISGRSRRDDDMALAVQAPVRTLAEAIELAYRTNPQLLSARALARSSDFRIAQARSAYGPSLTATGAYTLRRDRVETVPGTFAGAQGWSSTASLILSQPLFTFGRNAAAEQNAVANSEYQRDSLRVSEAQILNNVVITYVSVLRDAASVTIARENLALLTRQYDQNQERFRVRDLTLTDLQQTQTRVELGTAQLLQAEGQLGVSQKQFLQYVGVPPGELTAPDLLDIKFPSLAAAYVYAEANSPLIRAAQSREKISRAGINAAQAEYLPRVDVSGTADYGTYTPYSDQLRTTQIIGRVSLTQPLVDSGLRRARLGEAREVNQYDWRLIDAAFRDTRSAIGSAWDQLAASRASLASYRSAIVAAQRAYEGSLLQQKAGDRTTLDVLDLARDLLTVRTNYNIAVANEYLARSNLLAAAGMLEGPMIVPALTPYEPEDHYDRALRKADIPLITPILSGVDGIINRDTTRDRASRDAAAQQALDEALPLPPPDPATAP